MTQYRVGSPPHYRVYLDGHRVYAAQAADDEAGTVEAPLMTSSGRPVFDHAREDYAVVTRSGQVVLEPAGDDDLAFFRTFPALAASDYPFRSEFARDGELSPDYDRARLYDRALLVDRSRPDGSVDA